MLIIETSADLEMKSNDLKIKELHYLVTVNYNRDLVDVAAARTL